MKKYTVLALFFIVFFQSDLWAQKAIETNNADKKVVIIYGSEDCHYCIDTKKYLSDNKIAYVFYDIDKDKAALTEMLTKLRNAKISTNGLGIPVVDKYGEVFSNNTTFEDFINKLKTKP